MGEKSEKKQNVNEVEARVTAELDDALFGDLDEPLLADDDMVVSAPSTPTPRPARAKNYDEIWRETAMENINAAADTLAVIKSSDRQEWLAHLIEAIEKRLGPESLDLMTALIQDRRRKGKW